MIIEKCTDYIVINLKLRLTNFYQKPMDLLEYQAKKLFAQIGIPVLPSQPIYDPRELKALRIPLPVVLKSQVSVGGRGRAGGIRFVENTIDAMAAARTIFNLPILNQYPEVILAEARYNAVQEFFLAIVLDYQLQKPVLLGSSAGGIEVEKLLDSLQKVVIKNEFSSFYARQLVTKMGIKGKLINSVSDIVEKMYNLFSGKDLDLIEINPLGVNVNGELMALDGKISVNDYALSRHPDILSLTISEKQQVSEKILKKSNNTQLNWLDNLIQKGNIAIITNNLSIALLNGDLIAKQKGKVAGYMTIWQETQGHLLPNSELFKQLEQAIDLIKAKSEIKVVLINLFANEDTTKYIAEKIVNYHQIMTEKMVVQPGEDRIERPTGSAYRSRKKTTNTTSTSIKIQPESQLQFVLRLVGKKSAETQDILSKIPWYCTDDLEDAINQTLTLSNQK